MSMQTSTYQQETHYYPYGGLMGESTGGDVQCYKYNGKELNRMHGLDWYDYGARHYDAAILSWPTMDPLAEKYYSISPYAYCGDNPIMMLDPTGEEGIKYKDENGNNVIEANVIILLETPVVIPVDANIKTINRIEKKNKRIEKRNHYRIQSVQRSLEEYFSNLKNTKGETVLFRFNVKGIYVENPALEHIRQSIDIALSNGLCAKTPDRIKGSVGYGVALPAIISKAGAGANMGVTTGGFLVKLNDLSGSTLAHEIGHTFGLNDSYGGINGNGYGIMGSPPSVLLPSEVDEIWNNAYERE